MAQPRFGHRRAPAWPVRTVRPARCTLPHGDHLAGPRHRRAPLTLRHHLLSRLCTSSFSPPLSLPLSLALWTTDPTVCLFKLGGACPYGGIREPRTPCSAVGRCVKACTLCPALDDSRLVNRLLVTLGSRQLGLVRVRTGPAAVHTSNAPQAALDYSRRIHSRAGYDDVRACHGPAQRHITTVECTCARRVHAACMRAAQEEEEVGFISRCGS